MNKKEVVKIAMKRCIENNHKSLIRLNDSKSEKNVK